MTDLERALLIAIRLGVHMREMQAQHAQTRRPEDLRASKSAERTFDNAAREVMVAHALPAEAPR